MSLSAILANQARLAIQNYSGLDGSAIDSDDEDEVSCNGMPALSDFPFFSNWNIQKLLVLRPLTTPLPRRHSLLWIPSLPRARLLLSRADMNTSLF